MTKYLIIWVIQHRGADFFCQEFDYYWQHSQCMLVLYFLSAFHCIFCFPWPRSHLHLKTSACQRWVVLVRLVTATQKLVTLTVWRMAGRKKSLVLYCSLSSSHCYRRFLQATQVKSQNMERVEEKPVKVGTRERQKTQDTNWMTWEEEPRKVDANVIQKKYKIIGRRE